MSMKSAQTDRFVHDRLPTQALPTMRFDLPELRLPDQCNLVHELLDRAADKGWGERPLLRSPKIILSYADVRDRVDRICRVLPEDPGLVPGHRGHLRRGHTPGPLRPDLALPAPGAFPPRPSRHGRARHRDPRGGRPRARGHRPRRSRLRRKLPAGGPDQAAGMGPHRAGALLVRVIRELNLGEVGADPHLAHDPHRPIRDEAP